MRSSRFAKPYAERTDPEKVETNWIKTRGLFDREDWSMCAVRAAICIELAANLAIRAIHRNDLTTTEVDAALRRCRGINEKFRHVMLSTAGSALHGETESMLATAKEVARQRNLIVHGGIFLNEAEAIDLLAKAHGVVVELVRRYQPAFHLDEIRVSKHLRTKARAHETDESDESDSDSSESDVSGSRVIDSDVLPEDSRY